MNNKNFDKLIIKYINDELNEKETVYFKSLLNDPEYREYFNEFVELNYLVNANLKIDFSNSYTKFKTKIDKIEKRRKFAILKYAAAIILLISTGYFITQDNSKNNTAVVVDNEIEIGTNKATLTLEDGSNIVLVKGQDYNSENIKSNGEEVVYSSVNTVNDIKEVVYNYLTIPAGGEFNISLADGTNVWLNSNSKLKYPVEFISGKAREVEVIYGEAYFEVSPSTAHNGDKFRVISNEQSIEVLGTKFNIKAYDNDDSIETVLVEGRIAVSIDDQSRLIAPNEQLVYHKENKTIEINTVNAQDYISWKTGFYRFKNKSLLEVSKVLERWYDVEFVFENKELESLQIIGVLDKYQNIEFILITLKELNNINYEIIDNKIFIR